MADIAASDLPEVLEKASLSAPSPADVDFNAIRRCMDDFGFARVSGLFSSRKSAICSNASVPVSIHNSIANTTPTTLRHSATHFKKSSSGNHRHQQLRSTHPHFLPSTQWP
ncbi:MAG UNVERIFIED_CONTAM: hypothetical protein LVR18_20560 [Planctomycetaceae bacterium]